MPFIIPKPIWGKGEGSRESKREGIVQRDRGNVWKWNRYSRATLLCHQFGVHLKYFIGKEVLWDFREATKWNCTLGTNCLNEILVAYWIPMMLLLSQPHTGLMYSSYDDEESPMPCIFYTCCSFKKCGPPYLTGGRWPLAKTIILIKSHKPKNCHYRSNHTQACLSL